MRGPLTAISEAETPLGEKTRTINMPCDDNPPSADRITNSPYLLGLLCDLEVKSVDCNGNKKLRFIIMGNTDLSMGNTLIHL